MMPHHERKYRRATGDEIECIDGYKREQTASWRRLVSERALVANTAYGAVVTSHASDGPILSEKAGE